MVTSEMTVGMELEFTSASRATAMVVEVAPEPEPLVLRNLADR